MSKRITFIVIIFSILSIYMSKRITFIIIIIFQYFQFICQNALHLLLLFFQYFPFNMYIICLNRIPLFVNITQIVQPFIDITHRKRNTHIEMDRLCEPSC